MPLPIRTALLALALASPAAAQDLDARIDAASQRWRSYEERLQSTDPITRSETLAAALRDENDAIRSGALWYALRAKSGLSISAVIPPGASLDPGSLPTLDVTGTEWDRTRRSFRGRNLSHGISGIVDGELIEGTLRLVYGSLGFPFGFGTMDAEPAGRRQRAERRRCVLTLSFQPSRNALEGPLQCEGLSQRLTARLPL